MNIQAQITYSLDEIYQIISRSSLLGNLGLLVGAGFTRFLSNNKAYNWKELLNKVCNELNVTLDSSDISYTSSPQLATNICKKI